MSWNFLLNTGFMPLVVTAACMLLVCLCCGNRRLTASVIVMIALMYLWRSLYAVQSKRYFIILVVAMIAVTAAGADLLEKQLRSHWGSWSTYVVRGMFLLLIAACLGKVGRVNPHQDFIIRASEVLKSDAAKHDSPLVVDHSKNNNLRLEYYSGINTIRGKFFETLSASEVNAMADEAVNYGSSHDVVYFAVQDDKNSISDLERSGFVRVVSMPRTGKSGRKRFSIYRYAPTAELPGTTVGACLKSYDMEKCVSIPIPEAKAKLPELMACPEITLPEEWVPNFGDGFEAAARAVLKTEDAWSGKALHLAGGKLVTIFCPARKLPASKEYLVTFRYMTLAASRFRLKIYCYDDGGRMQGQFSVSSLKMGKTSSPAEFRCRLKAPESVSRGYSILAICLDYGDVLIDDLSIYESARP